MFAKPLQQRNGLQTTVVIAALDEQNENRRIFSLLLDCMQLNRNDISTFLNSKYEEMCKNSATAACA